MRFGYYGRIYQTYWCKIRRFYATWICLIKLVNPDLQINLDQYRQLQIIKSIKFVCSYHIFVWYWIYCWYFHNWESKWIAVNAQVYHGSVYTQSGSYAVLMSFACSSGPRICEQWQHEKLLHFHQTVFSMIEIPLITLLHGNNLYWWVLFIWLYIVLWWAKNNVLIFVMIALWDWYSHFNLNL